MLIKADKIVDDMHLLLVNDCQQYVFPVTHKNNLENKCLNCLFHCHSRRVREVVGREGEGLLDALNPSPPPPPPFDCFAFLYNRKTLNTRKI